MSTRNVDVIKAWSKGQPARSANLSTDGHRLYSYALVIGEYRDGTPVLFNYTAHTCTDRYGRKVPSAGYYSQTTSHHVGLARRVGYLVCGAGETVEEWRERMQREREQRAREQAQAQERCCCSDPDCPMGHTGECREVATTHLVRVDDADGERLPFCDACADDAYASGIFTTAEEDAESEEPQEPEEGDITTSDHRHFYQYGREVLTVSEDADYKAALRDYMEREGFYPDVWFISDHGNAHLLHVWEVTA